MNTISSPKSVGKDILSYCSKCKLTLSHIIVSMLDTRTVAKVKCNTCQAVHKFKDPGAATLTKKKAPRGSSLSSSSSSSKSMNIWEDAMAKSSTLPRPYSIKEKFSFGEIIDHPKFGKGVVDGFLDHDKILVVFQTEQKTLLHNKK